MFYRVAFELGPKFLYLVRNFLAAEFFHTPIIHLANLIEQVQFVHHALVFGVEFFNFMSSLDYQNIVMGMLPNQPVQFRRDVSMGLQGAGLIYDQGQAPAPTLKACWK